MKKNKITLLAMALMCAIGVSACSDGKDGKDGAPGEPGVPGTPGTPGAPAGSTVDTVATAADFKLTLQPADIVVVGADDFSIKFTATGKNSKGDDVPFTGLEKVALYVTNQVANTTSSGAPMLWSNNALANEFGSSMYCTPTGKAAARGGAEVDACTLVEDAENPGTYTGTWEHDGNAPVVVADGDPNSMFRVMIRTYDVTDATGVSISDKLLSTPLDFIPATGEMAVSAKDSVSSAACIQCHSELMGYDDGDKRIANIGAHHNYQKVENCIACHNPAYAADQNDPEKGFNPNFNAMIHTIHAGGHLAEWGVLKGDAEEFAGVHFPAELNECTTCHDNGNQWKENVYREACVGCHVTVNFETGEGHSDFQLPQADDSQCMNCHIGNLSPEVVHKVGNRAVEQEQVVLDFQGVTVTDNGDGTSALTVTTKVTVNGAAPADGSMLDPYMPRLSTGLLIGNVEQGGAPIRGLGMPVNGVAITGGILTTTKNFDSARLTGSIYVTAEVMICGAGGKAAMCADGDYTEVSASAPVKYYNLDDPAVAPMQARMSDADRVTVSEAKCNSCHGNLTHIKAPRHGVSEFTQCMDCHNNRYPGSYHGAVEYDTGEVDADGNPIMAPVEGLTFANRDLMTVAHRFHTGTFGGGIYLDKNLETVGYPALATDCQACHKDGATFFAADGGLTSGKRSIQVTATEYISPVAETCRTCHISASALAHFESNGATVHGKPDTTADLPVESCATCHAEGKTYGVDKVHAGGAH
ncbi:OmcA/MtrC family decaheme c-type cytochrome [Shewanella rhizosphaerae]|uniref:OmcA/MtrC family decaheme c-type cytochrome n=1 Tax=Shewanella rhizosphaerae TaxID=2864207 RepID=UPI001C656C45|nr:OmcA/MtrC family decaheme c-type cytochrome [Shewanella rhizosphaerae]QYK13825.1 OmcA/MtrC family decaheme c-type cytochrome [Shewanella rhizosphaerae]